MLINAVFVLFLACALAEDRYEREIRGHISPNRGGKPAAPHSHPWIVTMYTVGGVHCSGPLIRVCDACEQSDIVLTAAHCVTQMDGKNITRKLIRTKFVVMIAGKHWTKGFHPGEQYARIDNISVHPGWAVKDDFNDIAMMRMDTPFTFNENVTAIELPDPNNHLPSGSLCTHAGWGVQSTKGQDNPKELMEINGTIADHEECEKTFPSDQYNRKWMTCVSAVKGGGGTSCGGDSGGPLVCTSDKGQPMAYALSSFGGQECASAKENSVYTAVLPHLEWIHKTAYELTKVKKDGYLCKKAGVPCGGSD